MAAKQYKVILDECQRAYLVDLNAQKITLVCDNLNTHKKASLYKVFEPKEARRIAKKLEFHFTPKHGSWLNMAEIELSVLTRECLSALIVFAITGIVANANSKTKLAKENVNFLLDNNILYSLLIHKIQVKDSGNLNPVYLNLLNTQKYQILIFVLFIKNRDNLFVYLLIDSAILN